MSQRLTIRLDNQLCFALYAATNAVIRAYRPLLRKLGITYPQYLVLLVLWEHGPTPVNEIASRLELPGHAITPLITRLKDAGLVTRRRDEQDRRVVHVELTLAGARLEHEVALAAQQVGGQVGLDMGAIAALRTQLRKLAHDTTENSLAALDDADEVDDEEQAS